MDIRSSYMGAVFEPEQFSATVEKTIKAAELLRQEVRFDTIAFSGVSGSAMGFILGHWLSVPLICVRKMNDGSHFQGFQGVRCVEGNLSARRYMIVDDFISSGKTVNYIIDSISEQIPSARCVAMLMYEGLRDREHKHPNFDLPIKVISSKIDEVYGY